MHGELIEFNERLHRALVAKDALVSQMRQELIDLRGPVSAPTWEGLSLVLLLALSVYAGSAAHSHLVQFVHLWQWRGYRRVQGLRERVLVYPPSSFHVH